MFYWNKELHTAQRHKGDKLSICGSCQGARNILKSFSFPRNELLMLSQVCRENSPRWVVDSLYEFLIKTCWLLTPLNIIDIILILIEPFSDPHLNTNVASTCIFLSRIWLTPVIYIQCAYQCKHQFYYFKLLEMLLTIKMRMAWKNLAAARDRGCVLRCPQTNNAINILASGLCSHHKLFSNSITKSTFSKWCWRALDGVLCT